MAESTGAAGRTRWMGLAGGSIRSARWAVVLLVGALATATPGCGNSSGLIEVSGTVTFDGAPLDHGRLQLFAVDGDKGPAGGTEIRDGQYVVPAEHGLKPGKYRVKISSAGPLTGPDGPDAMVNSPAPAPERIPPQYNDQSKLTMDVTVDGENRFDFDLQKEP